MFDKAILREPSRLLRSMPVKSAKLKIERDGGQYEAGLIRGAAVVTRGEALGHGMWIDSEMLVQTTAAINAAGGGTKSRFTHPSLSGDGLGKALGRFRDAEQDGETVRADLHFFETAHRAPDGDLAAYVMDLAGEDPQAFGTSIAFEPDIGAEQEFIGKHSDKDGEFASPDPENSKGFPHARLAELEAVDFVDSPAANPDGLFHRGDEIAFAADDAMAYVFGLTDTPPAEWGLPISIERVRAFTERWLDEHELWVMTRQTAAPETTTQVIDSETERRHRSRERVLEMEREESS